MRKDKEQINQTELDNNIQTFLKTGEKEDELYDQLTLLSILIINEHFHRPTAPKDEIAHEMTAKMFSQLQRIKGKAFNYLYTVGLNAARRKFNRQKNYEQRIEKYAELLGKPIGEEDESIYDNEQRD